MCASHTDEPLASVENWLADTADILTMVWEQAEPILRQWVFVADQLTPDQWASLPKATHQRYHKLKALLKEVDEA